MSNEAVVVGRETMEGNTAVVMQERFSADPSKSIERIRELQHWRKDFWAKCPGDAIPVDLDSIESPWHAYDDIGILLARVVELDAQVLKEREAADACIHSLQRQLAAKQTLVPVLTPPGTKPSYPPIDVWDQILQQLRIGNEEYIPYSRRRLQEENERLFATLAAIEAKEQEPVHMPDTGNAAYEEGFTDGVQACGRRVAE